MRCMNTLQISFSTSSTSIQFECRKWEMGNCRAFLSKSEPSPDWKDLSMRSLRGNKSNHWFPGQAMNHSSIVSATMDFLQHLAKSKKDPTLTVISRKLYWGFVWGSFFNIWPSAFMRVWSHKHALLHQVCSCGHYMSIHVQYIVRQ